VTRLLLTGGTGFIGRQALSPLLERGDEVHATYRHEPGESRPGLTWHRTDLLDPVQAEALVQETRPTHLLHFAWYAEHGEFWSATENVIWVEATLRLLRAFVSAGGRRAVLAGSCAEYEWSGSGSWDGVCSELSTPLIPATLYGSCKHAVHLVAEGLAAETGLSLAWGRIFFVYGTYEHPGRLVSSLARALLGGEPAATTDGSQVRDFLHSTDVGSAFATLLDSSVEGAVNIGSGEATPVGRVVDLIAEAAGTPELVRRGELEPRPGDPPVLVADVRRLREEAGWQPSLSLESGIRKTVEWWSENEQLKGGGAGR
jgi:nucleoside-diphosphate-sugar epimerase